MSFSSLNDTETAAFERDGYIVVRDMVPAQRFAELRTIATDHLRQLIAPIEFEVDVGYPGAPVDVGSPGADTSRRLLQAFARDEAFRLWALDPEVKRTLACLLQTEENLSLSQCHHNCIMTKA
ncbi:MAG: phytanoyl-CoA dioxygenase family protein, partial [Gammaproteobacteria bacterium]|nr:phytanoyl-CoA dioxygenase family protein [Gammaproteobacteria bacterium]